MVTKDQALTANEFHFGTCTRVIGPRGRITDKTDHWRRNGVTKTWVTRPDEFQVPIKYGLRDCSYINDMSAHLMRHAGLATSMGNADRVEVSWLRPKRNRYSETRYGA